MNISLSKHELFCKALAEQKNLNITEEFNLVCKDLIEFLLLNKSPNATSNATLQTPVDQCAAYCDHNGMRSFLEDYKFYHHGYATLVVSWHHSSKYLDKINLQIRSWKLN
jgi:hypothetical protein